MGTWLMMMGMLFIADAHAEEAMAIQSDSANPTIIFGAAENPDGTENEVMVKQGADAPNPFGDPIVNTIPYGKQPVQKDNDAQTESTTPSVRQPAPPLGVKPADVISETSPQDPKISENSPEKMQNEIENTLYEGDDRIYDVQSYPDDDVSQIEGQDSAVTNYPAY